MKTVHFDNPKGEWFPKMHFLHVKHTFEHVGANYMCISCLRLVRMFLFVYSCITYVWLVTGCAYHGWRKSSLGHVVQPCYMIRLSRGDCNTLASHPLGACISAFRICTHEVSFEPSLRFNNLTLVFKPLKYSNVLDSLGSGSKGKGKKVVKVQLFYFTIFL